ncbi:MAG: carboxylesterase family protein [Acidobacteria bacterium]|nr:carboxylesterase family protein [Acidobacteriota bacterium]
MSSPALNRFALLFLLALPALPASAAKWLLPGVANASGANGTRFESRVLVTNLEAAPARVELRLVPSANTAAPSPVVRNLAAGETLVLGNALAELFGLSGAFGTLSVSSTSRLALFGVTANVAQPATEYGLALPLLAEESALGPGETGHALWLANTATGPPSRTNVTVALLEPGSSASVALFDSTGFIRGSRVISSDVPVTWQTSVAELAEDVELPDGRVEVRVRSGRAVAYTSVVDDVTGDGIAVLAERASETAGPLLLNGVARSPGANGSLWRTDVRLLNPTFETITATLHALGFSGTSLTVSLRPQALLELSDVLGPAGLAGGEVAAGAIRVESSGSVLALARTRNVDPSGRPGTFSGMKPALPLARIAGAGRTQTLPGVTVSGAYRTNLALLGGTAGGRVSMTLRGPSGERLAGPVSASLSAWEWTQKSLPDWFGISAAAAGSRVDLDVEAGSVDAYASVIQNGSGDPVLATPQERQGSPAGLPGVCAPPRIVAFTASADAVAAGASVALSLATDGAISAALTSGLALPVNGSLTVKPAGSATYRVEVTGGCGLVAESSVTVRLAPAIEVAETASGAVRGFAAGESVAWKGIPFALPPVGDLRFRPPVSPAPFTSVREARTFGSVCPQATEPGASTVTGAEDCLTLNVWRPLAPASSKLPVLFFIHGGGNVQGSGSETYYDGRYLAGGGDAVVVTLNYRLGALGSLAHDALDRESPKRASGGYGLLDQIAALHWVRTNIEAFGGDAGRILIFGESAGAVNVCALVASPLARGLFGSALMESGGCGAPALADVKQFDRGVIQAAGCASDAGSPGDPVPGSHEIACLRALSAERVTSAVPGLASVASSSGQLWGPVVDGWALPRSPQAALEAGTHNKVPFAVGSNSEETSRYVPAIPSAAAYQAAVLGQYGLVLGALVLQQYPATAYPTPQAAFVAVTTDARFGCPARRIARAASRADSPVFRYYFTHAVDSSPAAAFGAYHGLEIPFVFRTLTDIPGYRPSASELALADAMGRYWKRFAATGDPNGGADPAWPRYEAAADRVLLFDGGAIQEGGPVRSASCDFWDALLP